MIRNIAGSVLALAGATAAVWSPFRAWYDGRHGRDFAIGDLFTGITDAKADVLGSILLPFAFAALVTLVGVVLRSRLLVALAGLIVLGFAILWMVRIGEAEGSLTIDADGTGLGDGVAIALGGGVLLLLGALVMSGRRQHVHRVDRAPRHQHPPEPAGTQVPPVPPEALEAPPTGPPVPPVAGETLTEPPYGPPTQTYDVPAWERDRDQDRDDGRPPPPPPPQR
ncbi:hypothetical protein [Streptomyces sp. NRRL B-24572]|uniref:hypothetical protein n=1 Tax=Streptomyces sp. NRRL B-24572 TaxID=1962156 RepID=UPI000A360719|nr:hypothetical protein [Streptomyces sp. NRRL B-24572]